MQLDYQNFETNPKENLLLYYFSQINWHHPICPCTTLPRTADYPVPGISLSQDLPSSWVDMKLSISITSYVHINICNMADLEDFI